MLGDLEPLAILFLIPATHHVSYRNRRNAAIVVVREVLTEIRLNRIRTITAVAVRAFLFVIISVSVPVTIATSVGSIRDGELAVPGRGHEQARQSFPHVLGKNAN